MPRSLFLVLVLALVGCREVRVKSYATGAAVPGPTSIVVVRSERALEAFGIRQPVRFRKEFGVLLLMGPHRESGYTQVIESIRASIDRVRIVAFERAPLEGGDPVREYRTYTLWIVPNSVYRVGSHVDVVTPSGDPVASTTLR